MLRKIRKHYYKSKFIIYIFFKDEGIVRTIKRFIEYND